MTRKSLENKGISPIAKNKEVQIVVAVMSDVWDAIKTIKVQLFVEKWKQNYQKRNIKAFSKLLLMLSGLSAVCPSAVTILQLILPEQKPTQLSKAFHGLFSVQALAVLFPPLDFFASVQVWKRNELELHPCILTLKACDNCLSYSIAWYLQKNFH